MHFNLCLAALVLLLTRASVRAAGVDYKAEVPDCSAAVDCSTNTPWKVEGFCFCCPEDCSSNLPCDPKFGGCQAKAEDPSNRIGIGLIATSLVAIFVAPPLYYKLFPTVNQFSQGVLDD